IKERGLVTGHGNFPVYVDSPLAVEATSIFLQCDTQFLDDEMQGLIRSGVNPIFFPGLELAVSQAESQAINLNRTPKVILSTSGMCDAGRIRHHLKHNLWRPECRILFVGYQAEGTLGRLLVDGIKEVKLFNEEISVNAEIDVLPGVSGHADKMGLISWLKGFETKPELIFVNHGDPDAAESFVACLTGELGYRAFAPYSGTRFDLLRGEFDLIAEPRPIDSKKDSAPSGKAARLFQALIAAAERLLRVCKSMEGRPNKDLVRFEKEIEKLSDSMEK
ncbi:MAG: MBL fold metallo-hydrolase, partial [Oscillospiraceae bacterium]|nr:MBL fold metallo-hydrolase [Oscillospiraceae bacterium]